MIVQKDCNLIMTDLTIVIPNYNGAHLLRRNLPSVLQAAAAYAAGTEVIVVDDGSKDDSVDVLEKEFPQVRCVRHLENQGFSEAVLTGVKAAKTRLLFLLNSDVEMEVGCLRPLAGYFTEESTFSVNPLMLDEDGAVNRHSWNLRSMQRGYLKLDDWTIEQARVLRQSRKLSSLYACGGCMMVEKEKFMALGGFHPIFKPFYGEDYDLGIRGWYRGWKTYFEPNSTVIHQSQGSIKDNVKRARVKQVRRRNRYFLEWLHMSRSQLLLSTLPQSLFQLLGEIVILDKTNVKGFFTALASLPQVLAARRSILEGQVMTLDEIIHEIHAFDPLVKKGKP